MPRLRVEFTVEPFTEGRPGPHVTAALDAVSRLGLEPDVRAFDSVIEADAGLAVEALAALVDAAVAAGATRIALQVSTVDD